MAMQRQRISGVRPFEGVRLVQGRRATAAPRPCSATPESRQPCAPSSSMGGGHTADGAAAAAAAAAAACSADSTSACMHDPSPRSWPTVSRRNISWAAASLAAGMVLPSRPAQASKLGALDQAWESIGGGPADLFFPMNFLGVWEVTSTLTTVDKPLGDEYIPNKAPVERALREDLQKPTKFRVRYIPAPDGERVIFDRRYNTAAMLETYYGSSVDLAQRITWDPTDPNVLRVSMPGGLSVRTRVTRRSTNIPGPDRIETSEFFEQVYDDGVSPARLKANQCFTKYRWRDAAVAAQAGGPEIIATQVVSDYLTPFDGESLYMQAMNRPIVIYTYKMAFTRANPQIA